MSRKWKFADPSGLYFISYAVVGWVDVFVRNEYKQALVESWKYCQHQKGLEIYGWCIMPSHVHLIIGSQTMPLENIVRDMKRHTSEQMHKLITNHPQESRREWMLPIFNQAGINNCNNREWQFSAVVGVFTNNKRIVQAEFCLQVRKCKECENNIWYVPGSLVQLDLVTVIK